MRSARIVPKRKRVYEEEIVIDLGPRTESVLEAMAMRGPIKAAFTKAEIFRFLNLVEDLGPMGKKFEAILEAGLHRGRVKPLGRPSRER